MGNIFKDLTAGFASFVLAWLIPSILTCALIALFVYPALTERYASRDSVQRIEGFVSTNGLAATGLFALAVVVLALVTALGARPIYRLLEGYTIRGPLERYLLKRQYRRYRINQAQASRRARGYQRRRALAAERLGDYPDPRSGLLPTRLGNAYRSLETYSWKRYNLDSQTLYYELFAAAPEQCRRDADQARSAVDFFFSFVCLSTTLATLSVTTAILTNDRACFALGLASILMTRPAYNAAVRNMTDWRYAMQAIANTGRVQLAQSLGYELPATLAHERDFWDDWSHFAGRDYRRTLSRWDGHRLKTPPAVEGCSCSHQDT